MRQEKGEEQCGCGVRTCSWKLKLGNKAMLS